MRLNTFVSLGVVIVAACSHNSGGSSAPGDGGGGDAGGASVAQAAADVAKAYCDRLQACAPAYVSLADGDVTTCATRTSTVLAATFGANGSNMTPAQIEACAHAIPQVSCGDLLSRRTTAACKPPPGALADGAACAADGQCANGRCRVAFNQACGTCAKHAANGAACGVDDDCDDGLRCSGGSCAAFGNDGDTCDAAHPCRPDLGCKSGKCATPSTAGTACTDSAECDGTHGFFCGPASKQCDAVNFDPANAACGIIQGRLFLCAGPGGFCAGLSATSARGACVAPASDGAACDTAKGPLCNAGALCVCTATSDAGCTGTCTLVNPSTCR